MLIRCGLHRLGFRFRLHDRKLPGRPDLVSTMLTGGIHPPTWDQAVTACATYLEGCGAREGKDLAVEIRTRVHMPKAG